MQAHIDRITDMLWKDDGISGSMHYTEQISWLLFLKFLDDYEAGQELEASLNGTHYDRILSPEYQRSTRAAPKKDGKLDTLHALSGSDLREFVDDKLFPHLRSLLSDQEDYHSMRYKVGEIFSYVDNRIESWHTLRGVIDILDELSFQSSDDIFEMSQIYESILFNLGSGGGTSGEYYTPRPVVQAMVQALDLQIGETIYDGAAWSCGFLIEAYEDLKTKVKTTDDLTWLHRDALWGNEKTPIAYVMGLMNMILHGIQNPNLHKKNTLIDNIRDFEEKDWYDVILANPPFGGREKKQVQSNFPAKTSATELLFLQHFMKKLKTWGKAAIIVPEWVLFNTNNAFQEVKKELLEHYNLHTIVSLPAGIFLPYSGVKTNIIFFEKTTPTQEIWYYEVDQGHTLTKNKPITSEELADFITSYPDKSTGENSRVVAVEDIKDYDLSAKNPAKIKEIIHRAPAEILADIASTNEKIIKQSDTLRDIVL